MENIRSRVTEIVRTKQLGQAMAAVTEATRSLTSRVPIRFAAILVCGTINGFDDPNWTEFADGLKAFCVSGGAGIVSETEPPDTLRRAVVRFVSGDNNSLKKNVVEALVLYILYRAETSNPSLMDRKTFQACLCVDGTFRAASAIVERLLRPATDGCGGSSATGTLSVFQVPPPQSVQAMRSLHALLSPTRLPTDKQHTLFRNCEAGLETESYYAVFRRSTSRDRTVVAGFLAIRQSIVSGEVVTTFTHVTYDSLNLNARKTQGIVLQLDMSFYFIGATADDPRRAATTEGVQPLTPMNPEVGQIAAKGLKSFAVTVDQLNRSWSHPGGVYLSNDAGWKPLAGKLCMLHLGYRHDIGAVIHERIDPDLRFLDEVEGAPLPFGRWLQGVVADFGLGRSIGLPPADLEAAILAKLDMPETVLSDTGFPGGL